MTDSKFKGTGNLKADLETVEMLLKDMPVEDITPEYVEMLKRPAKITRFADPEE